LSKRVLEINPTSSPLYPRTLRSSS